MIDLEQWGVADRWSAPFETFATRRGDCEDYAIAKYAALHWAGIAEADLRLVIVDELVRGADHALLAVRFNGHWLLLDNRRLSLLEDVQMPEIVPLFTLDWNGVRQFSSDRTERSRHGADAISALR
jgi:predicted transglutaminase-like cysteine proteinase